MTSLGRITLAGLLLGALGSGLAGAQPRAATACALTPAQTEGPYYKEGAPSTADLDTPGVQGQKLTLTGRVLDAQCQPVAGATLDFWQADGAGQYDNAGYRLRGKVRTDAQGRYRLVTVTPGLYPGRTAHIHVKVSAPGGQPLTTQLYFPGVRQNDRDGIFTAQTLVKNFKTAGGASTASFDFVVAK